MDSFISKYFLGTKKPEAELRVTSKPKKIRSGMRIKKPLRLQHLDK
jgi:hypothetical protein